METKVEAMALILVGNPWIMYVDKASNVEGFEACMILASSDGVAAEQALNFNFKILNNEVECEALLAGLRLANELGVHHLKTFSDSQLVVGQVYGEYNVKAPTMERYLQKVKEITPSFSSFEIVQIPKAKNSQADLLSKLVTMEYPEIHKEAFMEYLEKPSIEDEHMIQVECEPRLMDPLIWQLRDGQLPEDQVEAHQIKSHSA